MTFLWSVDHFWQAKSLPAAKTIKYHPEDKNKTMNVGREMVRSRLV